MSKKPGRPRKEREDETLEEKELEVEVEQETDTDTLSLYDELHKVLDFGNNDVSTETFVSVVKNLKQENAELREKLVHADKLMEKISATKEIKISSPKLDDEDKEAIEFARRWLKHLYANSRNVEFRTAAVKHLGVLGKLV